MSAIRGETVGGGLSTRPVYFAHEGPPEVVMPADMLADLLGPSGLDRVIDYQRRIAVAPRGVLSAAVADPLNRQPHASGRGVAVNCAARFGRFPGNRKAAITIDSDHTKDETMYEQTIAPRQRGTVKANGLRRDKGFLFITANGIDYFAHKKDIGRFHRGAFESHVPTWTAVYEGCVLEFEETQSAKGPRAARVTLAS